MPGPMNHQAAMAMGNTERAWDDFYDRNYQPRECQAGVDAMVHWRSSMLSKIRQADVPVATVACNQETANNDEDAVRSDESRAPGMPPAAATSAAADDIIVILD